MDLDALLARAAELRASDVHISPGQRPALRVDGLLQQVGDPVSGAETKTLLRQLAPGNEREHPNLVFSHVRGGARYRVSAFTAQGRTCLAFRRVPEELPSLSDLGLESLRPVLSTGQGLILISGAAGSGRSWTAASLLSEINAARACHVLTLEDDVEHALEPHLAHVTRRLVGRDLPYRLEGIRAAVHLDADVLYAGSLDEGELFEAALETAEAGLLVIATVTAGSAQRALEGLLEHVAPARRPQRQAALVEQLRTALHQRLVPDPGGGRRPEFDVLAAPDVATLLSP